MRDNTSAIFIHSSWRTSSTWFWEKFRAFANNMCFYEPLNGFLDTITHDVAANWGADSWPSGHNVSAPYYREFTPLLRKRGGVSLYRHEMDMEWFTPVGGLYGTLRQPEKRYLRSLISYANASNSTPVMGCVRSMARLVAIKRCFPGLHIFLHRNLWSQWMSFLRLRVCGERGSYFYKMIFHMCASGDDSFFAYLRQYYSLADPIEVAHYHLSMPEPLAFELFAAIHIYLYMHAELNADVVVDTSLLAVDVNYRSRVEDELARRTALRLSFSDAYSVSRGAIAAPHNVEWEEIGRHLDVALSGITDQSRRRQMSDIAEKHLRRAIDRYAPT